MNSAEVASYLRSKPAEAFLGVYASDATEGLIDLPLIFREGEAADRFYLIRAVAGAVIADRGDGPREVARLAAGDFFGEVALMTGEPRNATIRVLEHSTLYWLEKETFLRVLEGRDSLRDRLIKVVFQRQ